MDREERLPSARGNMVSVGGVHFPVRLSTWL